MADRRLAWALVAVIVRYLTTIQPHANRELARWRCHAQAIPDAHLRQRVLRPFDADSSAAGAAIFAVLAPPRAQQRLVPLLVAYVLLWSYVDVASESDADPACCQALVDGLTPKVGQRRRPPDDIDYLSALLAASRIGCAKLQSWETVGPVALRLAHDGRSVQQINHGPPAHVEAQLRMWAGRSCERPWYEACAGASSPLAIHALMALAAHPGVTLQQAEETAAAYRPVSALAVLCDHMIDEAADATARSHSYLSYLDRQSVRAVAFGELTDRASRSVRGLPSGERHTVILAAMAAMFFSRPQASCPTNRAIARPVAEAIGAPAPQLLAALRMAELLASRLGGTTA